MYYPKAPPALITIRSTCLMATCTALIMLLTSVVIVVVVLLLLLLVVVIHE